MTSINFDSSICGVCGGQSGGTYVGVASVCGAPLSISWCDSCLARNTVPGWVLIHDFVFVADGDFANLAEWAQERETWDNGQYVSFRDYIAAHPVDVQKEQDEFATDLERLHHEDTQTHSE